MTSPSDNSCKWFCCICWWFVGQGNVYWMNSHILDEPHKKHMALGHSIACIPLNVMWLTDFVALVCMSPIFFLHWAARGYYSAILICGFTCCYWASIYIGLSRLLFPFWHVVFVWMMSLDIYVARLANACVCYILHITMMCNYKLSFSWIPLLEVRVIVCCFVT